MTKEVEKVVCNYCESIYKVLYDYEATQGKVRFCAFCGSECFDDEVMIDESNDED